MGRKKFLALGLGVILLTCVLLISFFSDKNPSETVEEVGDHPNVTGTTFEEDPGLERRLPVCGDSKCEGAENCFDCPRDCVCESGQYCSRDYRRCMDPSCGDGVCEPFEPGNCCSDCNCFFGEVCDNVTQECKPPEVNITEEKAKELIREYFSIQGKTVKSVTFKGARIREGTGLRIALVDLEESEWQVGVTVTEDLEVMEYDVL